MKIASASIEMQSSHVSLQHTRSSERLTAWQDAPGGTRRAPMPPTPEVDLSDKARAAQAVDAIGAAEDAAESDPRLSVLIRMIEFLTGKPVRIMRASDLHGSADAAASTKASEAPRQRAGFGIEYEFEASHAEFERVEFAAEGVVRTTDGAEIRFQVGFAMERSHAESVSMRFRAGDARLKDPLMLDFGGTAAALSDLRFAFDLDADGSTDQIPLAGGSGFLAFDRNANGRIDDGRELFGPTSGNGFAELARLDTDGNGWIDDGDADFDRLRLWQPDAEGRGTLKTLTQAGVGALYLGTVDTPFSVRNGANQTLGEMRASSIYLRDDGSVGTVSQVDLSV